MNISIQIQVCRACLKPPEAIKLIEYSLDSEIMKNYYELLNSEVIWKRARFFLSQALDFKARFTILSFKINLFISADSGTSSNILRQMRGEN